MQSRQRRSGTVRFLDDLQRGDFIGVYRSGPVAKAYDANDPGSCNETSANIGREPAKDIAGKKKPRLAVSAGSGYREELFIALCAQHGGYIEFLLWLYVQSEPAFRHNYTFLPV